MKILYDHSCFRWPYGGVPKYFVEMIKELPPNTWEIAIKYSNNQYLKESDLVKIKPFLPNVNINHKGIIINLLNLPNTLLAIQRGKLDIFHQTHYDNYAYNLKRNIKRVTTVYDMNFVKIPEFYKNNVLLKEQRKSVKWADKIIVISNNTKKDLVELWKVPEEKIQTIHLGCDKPITVPEGKLIKEKYLLFVGQRHSYKNFKIVLAMFASLIKQGLELSLVCTGPSFSQFEKNIFANLGLTQHIKHIFATEIQMKQLYRDAVCFIFPSFYEGFGMPLVEAMQMGCPVICSNNSSFPEIAERAAVYFEPKDETELKNKVIHIIQDKTERMRLVDLGRVRAAEFSWKKCADEHVELYETLL
jgi:glycosyltransferase involved in cell wall biosynthesis